MHAVGKNVTGIAQAKQLCTFSFNNTHTEYTLGFNSQNTHVIQLTSDPRYSIFLRIYSETIKHSKDTY